MTGGVYMAQKLTAIVPTYNCESVLQRCLENVKWADEILVVDSFSTDRTLEIARQYEARIVQHEYINSALQKNWAIPQARHDWILLLDSDEELEQGFQAEVRGVLEDPPDHIDGYRMSRKNMVYGKWIKSCGYYPDTLVRLFRRSCRYQEREVHAHIDITEERTGRFEHHLIHHDFTDLNKFLAKFPRYLGYELDQLVKEGRRFRLREITLRPAYFFLWCYIYKGGYRDGVRGLLLSVIRAVYNFMMYIKLWEYERKRS